MAENNIIFPTLGPDEIECRVQSTAVQQNGVFAVLLLYIDARAGMNALDNAFGPFGWQRSHDMIGDRLYCSILIKDPDTGEWVKKQDVGVESAQAAEKGQASDAFKRACVNVGIGRELYTSPTIKIELNEDEYRMHTVNGKQNANVKPWIKFHVQDIQYDDQRRITKVVIADQTGNVRCTASGRVRAERYLCACCGKPFAPFMHDGKQYTARDAYMNAQRRNPDGKARCKTCREKIEASKGE